MTKKTSLANPLPTTPVAEARPNWAKQSIVARCGKCRRGYIALPRSKQPWIDTYWPAGKYTGPPCGGQIIKLDTPEPNGG